MGKVKDGDVILTFGRCVLATIECACFAFEQEDFSLCVCARVFECMFGHVNAAEALCFRMSYYNLRALSRVGQGSPEL